MFSSTYRDDALDPQTERDLTEWLRSREPRTVSPTLWLRACADLREAALPAPRMPRLAGSMGTFASIAATALILAVVTGLVVATGMSHTGSAVEPLVPAIPHPSDSGGDQSPFLRELLILVVGMAAAAVPALSRRARGATRRLVWGTNPTTPPAPLPWLRPLRSVSRFVLPFTLLAATGGVLYAGSLLDFSAEIPASKLALWSVSTVCGLVLPVVVAWRYPWSHRASKWLIVATGTALAYYSIVGVPYRLGLSLPYPQWTAIDSGVALVGAAGLAAGIAGRAGLARPPSVRVAAALMALAFVPVGDLLLWGDRPEYVLYAAVAWVAAASWLSIAYVGLGALRSRPSLAWALLAVAAVAYVVDRLGGAILEMSFNLSGPGQSLIPDDVSMVLSNSFEIVRSLQGPLLLAALAIGLRPVFFDGREELAEAEVDSPEVPLESD